MGTIFMLFMSATVVNLFARVKNTSALPKQNGLLEIMALAPPKRGFSQLEKIIHSLEYDDMSLSDQLLTLQESVAYICPDMSFKEAVRVRTTFITALTSIRQGADHHEQRQQSSTYLN